MKRLGQQAIWPSPWSSPVMAPNIATQYSWNNAYGARNPSAWLPPAPAPQPINAAGQCYTCVDPGSGDIKSGVQSGMADSLRAKGYRCRKDECAERGGNGFTAMNFGAGSLYAGAAPISSTTMVQSPYAPFSGGSMLSGRRRLAQAIPAGLPLTLTYADALALLQKADGILSGSPICKADVIERIRTFINTTPANLQASATLDLSDSDRAALQAFSDCASRNLPNVENYDQKISGRTPELIGAALAAGLLIFAVMQ